MQTSEGAAGGSLASPLVATSRSLSKNVGLQTGCEISWGEREGKRFEEERAPTQNASHFPFSPQFSDAVAETRGVPLERPKTSALLPTWVCVSGQIARASVHDFASACLRREQNTLAFAEISAVTFLFVFFFL